MNQYGSRGPRRSDMRKKQRKNIILNSAIAVVVLAIVLVGGALIFGGNSETATTDDPDQTENNEGTAESPDGTDNTNTETEANQEDDDEATDDDKESDVEEKSASLSDEDEETDGEWQPVGTVQEEPFVAVFDKDHVNWEEMTRALQYATGLGDEMIIWRLGNGGDHQSAVGTVSTSENANKPFQVRLEWVSNEGWQPVSVEQLDSNPHR
ncbi:Protein of unknown function [Evansella caseinilytica]|uniref:DUF1510 domain-containing protein n=1 Tax=Evansella caseinilytica TaxID=1503961 RepID=A0A1H3KCV4_9BACI|nr:YrrS family protein [Evansella caseinilytica]SDY49364.1 Protein of unknown function [Evansella caseinilytica]